MQMDILKQLIFYVCMYVCFVQKCSTQIEIEKLLPASQKTKRKGTSCNLEMTSPRCVLCHTFTQDKQSLYSIHIY